MNNDRVAVVTGGARGIGWSIAAALAERGYHTVILDNGTSLDGSGTDSTPVSEAATRLSDKGLHCGWAFCDVADAASVTMAISQVEHEYGAVDVLVNVAGILRPGLFLDDTRETWESVISTHVGGHLNTINAVLPGMLSRQRGRIVNVTSTAGLLGSRRQPAYSMAKEAIVGLTRYLATRLEKSGIAVNAIAPSAATRMGAAPRGAETADRNEELLRDDPSCVGSFVGLLVDDDSDLVTGRTFLVTGNYVVEYEHLRPWKWAAAAPGAADVEECVRWVIGRPHPTAIGPWPTRDFRLLSVERNWEGTSFNPDLDNGAEDKVPPGGTVAFGLFGQVPKDISGAVGDVVWSEEWRERTTGAASGALVFVKPMGTGGGEPVPHVKSSERAVGLMELGDPVALCSDLVDLLAFVQSGVAVTARQSSHGVLLVLRGELPWQDESSLLRDWTLMHGAAGLIRGVAATEAIYGVRCNALICGTGREELVTPLIQYLLSPTSDWLNGYLLTVDSQGIGLLADEQPRWQSYGDGKDPQSLLWLRDRMRADSPL